MRIVNSSHIVPSDEDTAAPSDEDIAATGGERRTGSRVQTVMHVTRIVAAADQGLARIRNISDQGAQLRVQLPLSLGDALILNLADGATIDGRVVWISGDDCGIKFDRHIDCAALLTKLAAGAKQGSSRPVRLPVATSAVTRGANGVRLINVMDISQRGLKLKGDGSFTEGLHVKITLPSGRERRGVVRWSHDNIAGVMFLEPLRVDELGSTHDV